MVHQASGWDLLILSALFSHYLKDYKDYGDYWRANYETVDEPKYSYTRDELMTDVRRIYNEVIWYIACHVG